MPDLDLGPDDYRKQDRFGRWYVPDDPKALIIGIAADLVALAFIFWHRAEFDDAAVFFGIVALFAFTGGIFIALLLKRLNL